MRLGLHGPTAARLLPEEKLSAGLPVGALPLLSAASPLPHSLLSSLQSLTSLFYGEQSEKEKSPSESSPLDADNKDVVSSQLWQGQPGAALGFPGSLHHSLGCSQGTRCQ